MRLLTHNQLVCIVKGCGSSRALRVEATKVEQEETEPNLEFVANVMGKVDYAALHEVAVQVGIEGLPAPGAVPDFTRLSVDEHGDLLRLLHRVLLDTHVEEGQLVCQECSRAYPVQRGIPYMRLNESEI